MTETTNDPIQVTSVTLGKKIHYDRMPADSPIEHCWIKMDEPAISDLDSNLTQIIGYVCDLGYLAGDWAATGGVDSIKFIHSEDVYSATISISMPIEMQPRQKFTLRQMASDALKENPELLHLLNDTLDILRNYVYGDRHPDFTVKTQLSLFGDDESDDENLELDWDE
jgi:hypothetical protein